MQEISIHLRRSLPITLFDVLGILFIYFVPTLSHLLNFPLYYVEPMRLVIILSLVHTNKINAYFLAFTLPLFSFFLGGHPVVFKAVLIMLELSMNIWLFLVFSRIIKNYFLPIVLSIIISKLIYYALKILLIQFLWLDGDVFSTPISIQLITTFVFSMYAGLWFLKTRKEK